MRLPARRVQLPREVVRFFNASPFDSPCPRRFSNKHPRQFLAANNGSQRPQIPFLYPAGHYLSNGQLQRLFSISARQKKFIKETARLSVWYSIIIFIGTSSFSIASLGVLSERQERDFPSPHEWSLISRFRFRRGKWWQIDENNEDHGIANWGAVYWELLKTLERLEDVNKDGAGILEQGEEDIMVPGVGKAGYDVTAKSEEWRQGYYEVLIDMAKAAERCEGWITTWWRRHLIPPEYVDSPTNPRPRAIPPGGPTLPDHEHRVPVAEPPEVYYMKILTSKGLTTYHRVSAALGYADWLSFKKLPDAAEEMYRWALDIAIAGLPTTDPSTVINRETGVLSATAPKEHITPNIIYAATNLGTFLAEQGRLTTALPILVSLLRARLAAPEVSTPPYQPKPDSSVIGTLLTLHQEPAYPPVPPTGDEPLTRKETDRCEEAALKTYIGEVLFATSRTSLSQRTQGLLWVRDSVSTAKIAQSLDTIQPDTALRHKCEKCEEVGLEAWGKMMTYLAAEARKKRDVANGGGLTGLWWKIWGTDGLERDVADKEDEEEGVTMRLNKLRRRMMNEEYAELDRRYARTFVF